MKKIISSMLAISLFTFGTALGANEPPATNERVQNPTTSEAVKLNNIQDNKNVKNISESQKVKQWSAPVEGPIISEFCYGKDRPAGAIFNAGVKFDTKIGESVKVVADGIVLYAGYYGGYGLTVIIDHGDGFATLYAHSSEIKVSAAERVKAGDVICLTGQSGNVSRPIFHFEVRKNGEPMNPRNYLKDQ